MSSATDVQTKQVNAKVLYSEIDVPFNKYLDILSKTTRLTNKILQGSLNERDEDDMDLFNEEKLSKMMVDSQLRFLTLQNSIDTKKISYENWQQSNQSILANLNDNAKLALPNLLKCRQMLELKLKQIKLIYQNITVINEEIESLSDGKTSISISREQWESQLGKELTERLISENHLRRDNSRVRYDGQPKSPLDVKYRILDDFRVGPQEAERVNKSMKEDMKKLEKELNYYKEQWLKDAEIFSKITNVFQEEMRKRQIGSCTHEEMDVDEEEEEQEEEEDYEDDRYSMRSHGMDESELEEDIDNQSEDILGNDEENITGQIQEQEGGHIEGHTEEKDREESEKYSPVKENNEDIAPDEDMISDQESKPANTIQNNGGQEEEEHKEKDYNEINESHEHTPYRDSVQDHEQNLEQNSELI